MTNLFGESEPEISWNERYKRYLASAKWKSFCARLIEKAGHCCTKCGWQEVPELRRIRKLEVHHWTYERMGNELEIDVSVLCSVCHKAADIERMRKNLAIAKQKCADALHEARFAGWAAKRYGEDWAEFYDTWMDDEFEDFLNWTD